jgi:hypothetical protein
MNWNEVVQKVMPYVVKIETPRGHGTGFACFYNVTKAYVAIATAYHVVEHAHQWREPIRIHHPGSDVAFFKEGERFIFSDAARDSAVILIDASTLKLPETLIQLRPIEDPLPIGAEVGWLGYPAVTHTLCFFSGNVSAIDRFAYLIDGVAINGVSGGPVVFSHATEGVQIVGSISAYIANRATGEALPGLSVAQDVSHFHDTAAQIKSIDEAAKKQAEAAAAAAEAARASSPAPSSEPATPSS